MTASAMSTQAGSRPQLAVWGLMDNAKRRYLPAAPIKRYVNFNLINAPSRAPATMPAIAA
jgi:hypothetical protein